MVCRKVWIAPQATLTGSAEWETAKPAEWHEGELADSRRGPVAYCNLAKQEPFVSESKKWMLCAPGLRVKTSRCHPGSIIGFWPHANPQNQTREIDFEKTCKPHQQTPRDLSSGARFASEHPGPGLAKICCQKCAQVSTPEPC